MSKSLSFEIFKDHIQSIRKVDDWMCNVRDATGLDFGENVLAEEYFKSTSNLISSWYCEEAVDVFWQYIYEPETLIVDITSTESLYSYMEECNKGQGI